MSSLREQWRAGQETTGLWLTIASLASAEITSRQSVDYVCVDAQHGVIDAQSSVTMIQAIALSGGTPIVRVPWNDPGLIGQSLDAGAAGIVVPMVDTADAARAVVRAARYAPAGARSWGPMMAAMRHDDYRAWADENISVIAMIETAEALANLDEILTVDGLDALYVGPADLAISLGLGPYGNDGTPVFDDALARVVDACNRHGVVPGIHATDGQTRRRREQGFRMITMASDALALRAGYASALENAR